MQNRTPEEIQRQIDGLKSMKSWLPEHSHFGDPNWEKIDLQIDILNDTVYFGDLEEDEDLLESCGEDQLYNAAQEAEDWLNGDSDDDLFEVQK